MQDSSVYHGHGTVCNNLWSALDLAEDGHIIQIRRGNYVGSEIHPFVIDKCIKIYGETEKEYLLRKGFLGSRQSSTSSHFSDKEGRYRLRRSYFAGEIPQRYAQKGAKAWDKEQRISIATDLIPPMARIHVEQNSTFIIECPCILQNLELSSGHDCEYCHPLAQNPFSGLTVGACLLIQGCHIIAHQGSGFVVRGRLIMLACTVGKSYLISM